MAWWNGTSDESKAIDMNTRMAGLRQAAARTDADGGRYGISPEGYEKYGDYDGWGARPVRPVWTEEDQARINRIESDQQIYNDTMGKWYSGGPLSNRDYTFDVDGNTEAYSFSGDTLTPEAVQTMRNREGITPYDYPNGGRLQPHVGNSWWQASEPILPWNRDDWDETRKDWASSAAKWYNK